ncbi:hypothetical protein GSY69_12275 [Brevibacterium sp. 5221]|uniref:Uncharacterized protein n=1 Tax=Brevibacterium rongguiense TaxID=2695267 RepID=A0A6N9H9L8_9MICO|nr:hypothetical protein [Brevibacterium rongguiense]MYM20713.1 hypothetical protein [Brevibacterium rongguiense]
MGFFDALMGRSKPKPANLDDLFAVPPAVLTLQAATDFVPTGVAAVAFRAVEGGAIARAEEEARQLITSDPDTTVRTEEDDFGYTWLVIADANADTVNLVTNLHAVNTALESQGFGPMLLCSTVYFRSSQGVEAALVYLYKRGTFYPFVQAGPQRRDSAVEFNIKAAIGADLKFEADLEKWSPLWGAPGMSDPPRELPAP